MRALLVVMVLGCDGGTPEVWFCQERYRCIGETSIPELDETNDPAWCEARLPDATPDSRSAALERCVDCLRRQSCTNIEEGKCLTACTEIREAIATPGTVMGTVTGMCNATSTNIHATHQALEAFGELSIQIHCGHSRATWGTYEVVLVPPEDATVDQVPCGQFFAFDERGYVSHACEAAEGTLSVVSVDGRRSYVGTCSCLGETVTVDAPYIFAGWALTTPF